MRRLWARVKNFLTWANIKALCLRFFRFLRKLILNPRFLLCFGIAWIITNGWSYILFGVGMLLDIGWMTAVAGTYMALLWLPFTPEKIITFAIALGLQRWFFPNDKKTEEQLSDMKSDNKTKPKEDKTMPGEDKKSA